MKRSIPLKGAAEYDALTGWRKVLFFRPGERAAIKAKFNRRERRSVRKSLKHLED